MAHPGAYRGNKRQKEIKRLEKQKEKREKRQIKKTDGSPQDDGVPEFPLDGPILPEGVFPAESPEPQEPDTLPEPQVP
jgi:hypothetical protein